MWLSQTQFHTVSGILRNFRLREIGFSAQSVGFSLQFGNWEAFVLKGIFLDLRKDLIEFVLSLVRELQFLNRLSWMPFGMLNWVLEGMEIYEEKEKDMQERKRGLRNWEEGEKRSESDVWPNEERWLGTIVEWAKEDEEAAQPGLIRLFSLLRPALCTSFLLPSLTSCPLLKL